MDAAERPDDNAGCLSSLVSVALAALLLMLAVFPPASVMPAFYIPIFLVTGLVAALIGLPLYLLFRHLRRANIWTAIAAGAFTGALPPLVSALADGGGWRFIAVYAAVGAIGGLAFYLTATVSRAPRRNAALLLALTAASVLTVTFTGPIR